jgi:hypothetical protein
MSTDKKLCPKIRVLRTERLNEFRRCGYKFLADGIRAFSGSSAELELLEAITEEGKEYQIEVTAFWDDKPDQDIRATILSSKFQIQLIMLALRKANKLISVGCRRIV